MLTDLTDLAVFACILGGASLLVWAAVSVFEANTENARLRKRNAQLEERLACIRSVMLEPGERIVDDD